jgi:hypothetical protein
MPRFCDVFLQRPTFAVSRSKSHEVSVHEQKLPYLYFEVMKTISFAICSDVLYVSGDGLPRNWMILLGHRRLQYIEEEPLGVAGG